MSGIKVIRLSPKAQLRRKQGVAHDNGTKSEEERILARAYFYRGIAVPADGQSVAKSAGVRRADAIEPHLATHTHRAASGVALTKMNLSGLQQRLAVFSGGKGGSENPAVAFKSRPVCMNAMRPAPGMALRAQSTGYCHPFPDGPAWKVSLELQASENGALLRHIKILITDEKRAEPGGAN